MLCLAPDGPDGSITRIVAATYDYGSHFGAPAAATFQPKRDDARGDWNARLLERTET